MRKRLIESDLSERRQGEWFNLEPLAEVEITSEEPDHPIENALLRDRKGKWRAASEGEQTIRLLFIDPLPIRRIRLHFLEEERMRTQEFILRWSKDCGESWQDLVRQQYVFSPPGTDEEIEEFRVELEKVTALELVIRPEIGGGESRATLESFQIA